MFPCVTATKTVLNLSNGGKWMKKNKNSRNFFEFVNGINNSSCNR